MIKENNDCCRDLDVDTSTYYLLAVVLFQIVVSLKNCLSVSDLRNTTFAQVDKHSTLWKIITIILY